MSFLLCFDSIDNFMSYLCFDSIDLNRGYNGPRGLLVWVLLLEGVVFFDTVDAGVDA